MTYLKAYCCTLYIIITVLISSLKPQTIELIYLKNILRMRVSKRIHRYISRNQMSYIDDPTLTNYKDHHIIVYTHHLGEALILKETFLKL